MKMKEILQLILILIEVLIKYKKTIKACKNLEEKLQNLKIVED